MIAVMTENQDQIFEGIEPEGKMPVKFCSLTPVIMGDKLSKKRYVFYEEDDVSKTIIPSIIRSFKIVVTGKVAGKLEVSKKLAMKSDSVFLEERFFILVRPIDEDFLAEQDTSSQDKKNAKECGIELFVSSHSKYLDQSHPIYDDFLRSCQGET